MISFEKLIGYTSFENEVVKIEPFLYLRWIIAVVSFEVIIIVSIFHFHNDSIKGTINASKY